MGHLAQGFGSLGIFPRGDGILYTTQSLSFWGIEKPDQHCDPHCWVRTGLIKRTGREARLSVRCAVCFQMSLLYLCHEITRGLGGFVLLLPCGAGVGLEGELGAAVLQQVLVELLNLSARHHGRSRRRQNPPRSPAQVYIQRGTSPERSRLAARSQDPPASLVTPFFLLQRRKF